MHSDGAVAFTGIPALPAISPTTPNHATRKQYVDDRDAATAATAATALTTHVASGDHDGRYYTEAEINALLANRPITRSGVTSCVFNPGFGTTSPVTVTVPGAGTIYNVMLQPSSHGVMTAVTSFSGNQFTFIGSLVNDTIAANLGTRPITVNLTYLVVCAT
jgi:hypothetical protein